MEVTPEQWFSDEARALVTTEERLATLERQMAEVRAALFLDDKNLVGDLIGRQPKWCAFCDVDTTQSRTPGVAYLMEGDERTGGMVCEQHILPATLAGYGIDRTVRRTR